MLKPRALLATVAGGAVPTRHASVLHEVGVCVKCRVSLPPHLLDQQGILPGAFASDV